MDATRPEIIVVSSRAVRLPEQGRLEHWHADALTPADAAALDVRRGETAVIERRTERRYLHPSKFEPYFGYYAHDDDPADVEIIAAFRWTGKTWKPA